MVTRSDYVTLCDIYCHTVTQHLEMKYKTSVIVNVIRYGSSEMGEGVKKQTFHSLADVFVPTLMSVLS